jgi:GNAT superfamily N-acetyltransferase
MIEAPDVIVRPARPEDAESIAALLTEEGYPTGPSDVVTRLAGFEGPDGAVLVADLDDRPLGFIALRAVPRFEHDDAFVRILALVVDPGARERGVGHRLMAAAEAFAAERAAAFVEVTAGRHRPEAKQLYEALGYDGTLTAYLRKRF